MDIEKKALYNLFRMNWLNDSSFQAESWQIEDYRSMPTKKIFASLHKLGFPIDQTSFLAYSEEVSSPEELTDLYLADTELDPKTQDLIYLLLFELWRRLLPERLCLSIFCDELDHQIYLYDKGDPAQAESIQDAIAKLQMIMDENVDAGVEPTEILQVVTASCANDLETFFYDYISEQIELNNRVYARELLDGLASYYKGNKWFSLLKVRLIDDDNDEMHEELRKVVQRAIKEEDLIFNLELLSLIVHFGEEEEFNKIVRRTVSLLQKEEDFLDLLSICCDYYRCLDKDQKEADIQKIIDAREQADTAQPLSPSDPDLARLLKILKA